MKAEGQIHWSTKTCPICGKEFLPAPEHAWKIGGTYNQIKDRHDNRYSKNIVCSYSCMRKWEVEQYGPRKRRKRDYEPKGSRY